MKKHLFGGLLAGLAAVAAALAIGRHPHQPPPLDPPAVPSYTLSVHVCRGDCAADHKLAGASVRLDDGAIAALTDGAGNVAFERVPAGRYRICAEFAGYTSTCDDHAVPADGDAFLGLEPTVAPVVPLSADGRIFCQNGQAWRWKGVSSFALLNRFAKGDDISDVVTAYKGYNLARVFCYTPAKDWGVRAWDTPAPALVVAFLERMAREGWYVELTLLTDDDPARIPVARRLIAALVAARPPNVVLEIGNEPTTHKAIDTSALRADALASGFLVSSGDYEDTRRWYGAWLGFHSARDGEWPRRAHDALDYWTGGGPDFAEEPPVKAPAVCDEPIRPDQAAYASADFRAYAGACALLGAGLTYHTETGKFGLPPTPQEAAIATTVLEALNAFPADAPLGAYKRLDERGGSLRTYVVGEAMVRIRPTTTAAPEAGWIALDDAGILWRR